jgi:hypothetical protein
MIRRPTIYTLHLMTVNAIKAKKMKGVGHPEYMSQMGNAHKNCSLNINEKPLGRPKRKWEDNIKMDITKVGCRIVD